MALTSNSHKLTCTWVTDFYYFQYNSVVDVTVPNIVVNTQSVMVLVLLDTYTYICTSAHIIISFARDKLCL